MNDSKKKLMIAIVSTVAAGVLLLAVILGTRGSAGGAVTGSGDAAVAQAGAGAVQGSSGELVASQTDAGSQSADAAVVTDAQTPAAGGAGAVNTNSFYAEISTANSWGEAPIFKQLDIRLVNKSGMDINGWTLAINVGDAKIDSGWSGNYSISGGVLTVTGVDYNNTITSGSNADIGVILSGITGDLSYTLTAGSTTVSGTANNNTNNNSGNSQTANNNSGNGGNQGNAQTGAALPVPAPTTDDWLHTDGNGIYDKNGKRVWLTGCNWFGYNTGTNTFDGLWACDLNNSIKGIADHGFNLLRVPISAELILQWKSGKAPEANFNQATNAYLVGMDSLQIFDYVVGQCRANGLKIMLDIHSAETNASGHTVNLWYTDKITAAQYEEALAWMADRYKNDDTIIAFDLKNEPHGKPNEGASAAVWNNSTAANNWKYEAERAASAVLAKNPNVLIMVEGTEIYPKNIAANGDFHSANSEDYYFNWWGGNLRGVADYPVDLGKYNNKLVYSPHDYGPTVFEQPWFSGNYTYDSLMKDCWHDNWFYIHENGTAPLLIGEWGGYMTEPNITWMTYMRQLISKNHLNHTFWCFNANSGDTGGLVKDDFITWDTEKYNFVKEVLWQENGKFVGLDHQIPLGTAGNGITLTEAKGL
ncbi:MAG: cellulase family glycosylhydrolase [Lachnospiraceae bacterium]|nr:cellulase family glycosylhydrolase [Lachnospiraceae bacterium]